MNTEDVRYTSVSIKREENVFVHVCLKYLRKHTAEIERLSPLQGGWGRGDPGWWRRLCMYIYTFILFFPTHMRVLYLYIYLFNFHL